MDYDVPEGHRATRTLHERRGRQLQAKQRPQLVDGANAGARAVAVRLVHQQHQVGQAGQMVEVAVAQHLAHALDARLPAAPHFRVDLADVEDVDAHLTQQAAAGRVALVVVVAGDHHRRVGGELGDALEDVLRRVRSEVGLQLLVDGEIGGQHEEVLHPVGQMQVADESAHQAGLADTGGQRKAQRREFALEVLQRRKLGFQRGEHRFERALALQHRGRSLQGLR